MYSGSHKFHFHVVLEISFIPFGPIAALIGHRNSKRNFGIFFFFFIYFVCKRYSILEDKTFQVD